jgi:hypothetical protein
VLVTIGAKIGEGYFDSYVAGVVRASGVAVPICSAADKRSSVAG